MKTPTIAALRLSRVLHERGYCPYPNESKDRSIILLAQTIDRETQLPVIISTLGDICKEVWEHNGRQSDLANAILCIAEAKTVLAQNTETENEK